MRLREEDALTHGKFIVLWGRGQVSIAPGNSPSPSLARQNGLFTCCCARISTASTARDGRDAELHDDILEEIDG